MFKLLAPTLALALAGANTVSATDYYVTKTGNDGNTGTASQPWLTIGHAAIKANAGDTVHVGQGTYTENVTFGNSGTSGSPITFIGTPGPVMGYPFPRVLAGNATVTGDYVTLNGFTIEPPLWTDSEAPYGSALRGTFDIFTNCLFDSLGADASIQAAAILMDGSYDLVTTCTIQNLLDIDVFHVWGHDQLIQSNIVNNIQEDSASKNHTDIIQTWGGQDTNGIYSESYNVTVDGNLFTNCTCQAGNTEIRIEGDVYIHDWQFQNNIIANVASPFFSGIPNTRFFNNIFYLDAFNPYSDPNAIVFYTDTTATNVRSSTGSMVVNNVFLECGYATDYRIQYQGTIGNRNTDESTVDVDYNDFRGPPAFPTKSVPNSSTWVGTHYLNGADPGFNNLGLNDYHIWPSSPLAGAGLNLSSYFTKDRDCLARSASGAWDIGPYVPIANQYVNMVLSGPDTIYQSYSGWSFDSITTITFSRFDINGNPLTRGYFTVGFDIGADDDTDAAEGLDFVLSDNVTIGPVDLVVIPDGASSVQVTVQAIWDPSFNPPTMPAPATLYANPPYYNTGWDTSLTINIYQH